MGKGQVAAVECATHTLVDMIKILPRAGAPVASTDLWHRCVKVCVVVRGPVAVMNTICKSIEIERVYLAYASISVFIIKEVKMEPSGQT